MEFPAKRRFTFGKVLQVEMFPQLLYKQPDTDTLKKVLKEKGVRNELKEILADLKGLAGIADEAGDLSKKRKGRDDNDDAIKMLEKIAGI